jgi:hypothetical protein
LNGLKWAALILLIAGSAADAGERPRMVQGVALQSAETLDGDALNARAKTLAAKPAAANPISLALALVGSSEETPQIVVEMSSDEAADFNRATVTVIREGFQDDSVRGDWHEFQLSRGADGAWTVLRAERAFRCWRGSDKTYAARHCP